MPRLRYTTGSAPTKLTPSVVAPFAGCGRLSPTPRGTVPENEWPRAFSSRLDGTWQGRIGEGQERLMRFEGDREVTLFEQAASCRAFGSRPVRSRAPRRRGNEELTRAMS